MRTADAFLVVTSLPPKNSYFLEEERRGQEMRLLFAGYRECGFSEKRCESLVDLFVNDIVKEKAGK